MSANSIFEDTSSKLQSVLGLRENGHAVNLEKDNWESGNYKGSVQGFSGTKVDWFVKSVASGAGTTNQLIQAWTMPMFDVPHLIISFTQGQGLEIDIDIIPKDDVAYNQIYLEQYFGSDIVQWFDNYATSPLVTLKQPPRDLVSRVLGSPVKLSLKVEEGPEGEKLVADAVAQLVDKWLGWLDGATEIPRVRRGTMLSRDKILRRISWAALSKQPWFGPDASAVAAAVAGPSDEPYTGQAS